MRHLIAALLLATTLQAQALPPDRLVAPLENPAARHVLDIGSTLTTAAAVATDTWASWQASDRRGAFLHQAERDGAAVLASELVKRLVHRERPLGQDNLSFWSEHTALTAVSTCTSGRYGILIPVTAFGRMLSGWHYLTDTLAGAAVGCALAWRIR